MGNRFFEKPILNSPYEYPASHWELQDGQPTQAIIPARRKAEFITPIPKPKTQKGKAKQEKLGLDDGTGLSTAEAAVLLPSGSGGGRDLAKRKFRLIRARQASAFWTI